MPLLWRSSRESRSERCKRAFLLAPICKVLLAPSLVSDRATIAAGNITYKLAEADQHQQHAAAKREQLGI